MDKKQKGILAQVCLSLFLFILIQIIYKGVTSSPKELDSILYHIPIAKSFLTGDIFSSPKSPLLHRFFPGASEGILALFITFHIPLNLFNVLGILSLFFSIFFLGKSGGLKKESALVVAVGFSSLMGVVRWADTQIVDIWIAAYYAMLLGLLLKPNKNLGYFVKLGFISGMLIGSKYAGPLYVIAPFIVFGKDLYKKARLSTFLGFIIPVLCVGGFWYLRNFFVMGNPIYPISVFGLPGVKNWALELSVGQAIISYPISFITACISEYIGWFILSLIVFICTVFNFIKQRKLSLNLVLVLVSFLNFVFYLFMPNAGTYQVHLSNLRYSYPIFIPLFLVIFRFAHARKYDGLLFIFTLAQILFALQFPYHPKLFFLFIPLIMLQWYQYGRR